MDRELESLKEVSSLIKQETKLTCKRSDNAYAHYDL